MSSIDSLKEIMSQTSQTDNSPQYGARALDLGGIATFGSVGTSPLASTIGSIPSYTPPPQQESNKFPSFGDIGLPGLNLGKSSVTIPSNTPPSGSIGQVGGLNTGSTFFPSFGSSTYKNDNPLGTGGAEGPTFGTGSSGSYSLISGPDTYGSFSGETA